MRRLCVALLGIALLVLGCAFSAANFKLYMTDGSYQLVNEYKVEQDRVRFYSTERSEWEEVPLELVDLKRTKATADALQQAEEKGKRLTAEDDEMRQALRKEIKRVPQDPGVYWFEGDKTYHLNACESTLHTDKGREIWRRLSPLPTVPGTATLEIPSPHSEHIFTDAAPEFYIQLSEQENFGIVRVTPKKDLRVVATVTIDAMTKEIEEEWALMDIIQQQLTPDGLYKFWPKVDLALGEYAVIEYTPNKRNAQIWDFAVVKPAK
jgi:hypothetical protein